MKDSNLLLHDTGNEATVGVLAPPPKSCHPDANLRHELSHSFGKFPSDLPDA